MIYHIVLFKLKPGTSEERIEEMKAAGAAMVGQVPGLRKFDCAPPLEATAHRAQGYDLGLIAVLDRPEDIKTYAEHPAHLKVHALREAICDETLAYDMEV